MFVWTLSSSKNQTIKCITVSTKILSNTTVFNIDNKTYFLKELFSFNILLLIIYSPPCHPRCPCLSFLSRKEVFDENIPGFFSI